LLTAKVRTSTEELAEIFADVERIVRVNTNGLFSPKFTSEVQKQLNAEEFTCVVTCPFKLANLIERVKVFLSKSNNNIYYFIPMTKA